MVSTVVFECLLRPFVFILLRVDLQMVRIVLFQFGHDLQDGIITFRILRMYLSCEFFRRYFLPQSEQFLVFSSDLIAQLLLLFLGFASFNS